MTEKHVVSALRAKRAEISGHIHDLEKRIARQRANLANLDATIKLFSPGTNPDSIPPKRAYRRTRYFAHNELSRLTQDALRTASGPLTSADIAAAVMQAKGMPPSDAAFKEIVAERALTVLRIPPSNLLSQARKSAGHNRRVPQRARHLAQAARQVR
jgi:hypothetical protein